MAMVYVRDKSDRKIKYVEEGFSSLVWTERYQEPGDFILEIPLKDANVEMYQMGDYISMDESQESMIIQSIDINDDIEEPLLKIEGRTLTTILDRRVDQPGYFNKYAGFYESAGGGIVRHSRGNPTYKGKYSDLIEQIFTDNVTNPIIEGMYFDWVEEVQEDGTTSGKWVLKMSSTPAPERKINNISFQNLISDSDDVEIEVQTSEVLDLVSLFTKLAKKAVKGFRVIFDSNNNFVLQAYSGKDRRTSQKTLSPVIFNPIMDNITYVNYHQDDYNYKTIGFGYAEEYTITEGLFDTMFVDDGSYWSKGVDGNPSGFERREVSLDMRSQGSSVTDEETGETLDPIEAKFEDGDYEKIQTSEGSVDPLAQYKFEEDYFLGDLVDLNNANGIFMEAIIDEVVRSYDSDGIIVTPNFKNLEEYDDGEEDS